MEMTERRVPKSIDNPRWNVQRHAADKLIKQYWDTVRTVKGYPNETAPAAAWIQFFCGIYFLALRTTILREHEDNFTVSVAEINSAKCNKDINSYEELSTGISGNSK